jgi:hypothetical protein
MPCIFHTRFSIVIIGIILSLHYLIDFEHRFGQLSEISSSYYENFSVFYTNLDCLKVVWKIEIAGNSILGDIQISSIENIKLL